MAKVDEELDQALEMTFPASDPIAIGAPKEQPPPSKRPRAAARQSPAKARRRRTARRT